MFEEIMKKRVIKLNLSKSYVLGDTLFVSEKLLIDTLESNSSLQELIMTIPDQTLVPKILSSLLHHSNIKAIRIICENKLDELTP